MKRFISLALVLVMVISGIVAFAEEAPTTVKTPRVIYSFQIGGKEDNTRMGILEVMGYEDKQPLIFRDTPENPKTGFSRLTREEIQLLPEEHWTIKGIDDPEMIWERDTLLRKVLLEYETLFKYTTKKDGTVIRELRTRVNTKIIMDYGERDEKNCLVPHVKDIEKPLFYEFAAAFIIDELTPNVKIDRVDGTIFKQLDAIYASIAEDTGPNKIAQYYAGWVKKSKQQAESDKEYVTKLLLGVTEEDFDEVYNRLLLFLMAFTYKFNNEESAVIILRK